MASLFEGALSQVSVGSGVSMMVDEEQRARLLGGLFENYYADREESVIFDTNRAWTAKLPALMKLFPKSKLIYEFLGEEEFAHDLNSVSYEAPGFDEYLGLDKLHRVEGKIEPRPRETIFPPDLFHKYAQLSF